MPNSQSRDSRSLAAIGVFQSLDDDALRDIESRCSAKIYRSGQTIIEEGDSSGYVYCLTAGRARAITYAQSGKDVIYRDIPAGEVFGEFGAIDGEPRSSNVEAIEDSTIVSMTPEVFWWVLERYPSVMRAVMQNLSRQLRFLTSRVFEFSAFAVKSRIQVELLRMAMEKETGSKEVIIKSPPTHAELASRLSTHREAVTRELNALARAGMLKIKRGELVVTDLQRLKDLVRTVRGED